jgi:hypothetical protein
MRPPVGWAGRFVWLAVGVVGSGVAVECRWWFLPSLVCLPLMTATASQPPLLLHTLQVVRISDGQVYAMKKVSIASMSQKEIADTLNEIR